MPWNTTTNDTLLPESSTELPQGTLAEDAPFELHICDQFIINSMVNFLKGVRNPYIREHSFSLLRSTLCLMMEVPIATAYLQENEDEGLPIFVWLLDMPANICRTSEGSRRKAYMDTIFKRLVYGFNLDYKSKPSARHRHPYSSFKLLLDHLRLPIPHGFLNLRWFGEPPSSIPGDIWLMCTLVLFKFLSEFGD